ncbi:MAG: hypothetical protein ACRD2L_02035 [Terriglobia bacterium]
MTGPGSTILLYGKGGIGKSTLIAQAAAYVAKTTGKKSRVVNADGGGTSAALEGLVEEGIAEIWNIDQWNEAGMFASLQLASKGYWPSDTSIPNSSLLPPSRIWRKCLFCSGDSGAKSLTMVKACEACKKEFPAGTLLPVEYDLINGIDQIGLLAFEGMTSFGDLLLARFRDIDKSGAAQVIKDGEFGIAQVGMQHYLLAQHYMMQFLQNIRTVPVELIMWTALELKGDDDGKPLYGPAGPGKKLTTLCIPKFTSVIHVDAVAKRSPTGAILKAQDGTEILERKMYLAPHSPIDAPGQWFSAKTSAPAGGGMPSVLDCDMAVFFEEMQKAKAEAKKKLLAK